MALLVAGDRSNSGKTTVTLALLAALVEQGRSVQSFKVGPDYIDPMFHSRLTGRPCRNLDPWLTSRDYVHRCFGHWGSAADAVLVEGVMGLYDGRGGTWDGSAADLAVQLGLPVLLVIDCAHLSNSVAALVQGYRSLNPHLGLAGVVLNRVSSDRHEQFLRAALDPLGVPVLGVLRRQPDLRLPERHLGLVPVEELPEWPQFQARLVQLGRSSFDWQRLEPLLEPPPSRPLDWPEPSGNGVRLAIARDRAFNFYYADNLDLLRYLGAELVAWSPLADQALPEDCRAVLLGGGFPELVAADLSTCQRSWTTLRAAVANGVSVYGECGGLMVLGQTLTDLQGQSWPMAGLLPHATRMASRLTLGYREAMVTQGWGWLRRGEQVRGHEFHRSELLPAATAPLFRWQEHRDGLVVGRVAASYLHHHWGDRPTGIRTWLSDLRKADEGI